MLHRYMVAVKQDTVLSNVILIESIQLGESVVQQGYIVEFIDPDDKCVPIQSSREWQSNINTACTWCIYYKGSHNMM